MRLGWARWRHAVQAITLTAALAAGLPAFPAMARDGSARAPADMAAAADSSSAATAIALLATPLSEADALRATPSNFAQVMGYKPIHATLANGEVLTVNPHGGCSVPGGVHGLDIETVCKAHDLGYDLLRYAERRGVPLGPDARERIDAKFERDLNAQCSAAYRDQDAAVCKAVGLSFSSAVRFNSWRQMDGPPIDRSGLIRTVGLGLLGLVGVGFTAAAGWRWGRRYLNLVARR